MFRVFLIIKQIDDLAILLEPQDEKNTSEGSKLKSIREKTGQFIFLDNVFRGSLALLI